MYMQTVLFKTIIDGARISALSAQTEHISERYKHVFILIVMFVLVSIIPVYSYT